MRSRDKLKTKYFLLHNACDHQTWWDGDLKWEEFIHNVTWPSDHMIIWVHVTIKNKISPLLQGLWAYGHQIWQGGDLWWWKLSHNVRWLSDHVIAWGRVTKWKLNISSSARSMTTRLKTYGNRNLSIESQDPMTWWSVVTWRIKSVTYPLWPGPWSWTVTSWWLMVRWKHPWSHMSL